MRFRLRYLHHDLELTEGEFAVGRSAGCQLSLDDPLVSRRHALLIVSQDRVTVEDLKSRNGVVLNGQRVVGRVAVKPGDKIVIGAQELTLLEGGREGNRETAAMTMGKRTLPRVPVVAELPGSDYSSSAPPYDAATDIEAEPSLVRRAGGFNLIGGVAEKALVMGRSDEAERLLSAALAEIMEATRAGKRLSPALIDTAARFAAKLATATTKGGWADYVIELYDILGRPCPAAVVDELNIAYRKVNAIDLTRLREYLAHLRVKQASLGPAERFLLQRIEGLERLAALR